jgi:DNA-binding NarL/FixJ family response regulator
MTSLTRWRWALRVRTQSAVTSVEEPRWCLIVNDQAGDYVTAEALRVVIADDHPYYRKGLARLLEASGLEVLADVPNGEAAIEAVTATAPDVVVMDLNMPGMSGLEATRRLAELAPATRVLILSVSADEADVTDAILAGANGYVLKDGPVEEVVAGIQAAATGQALISPRIATVLLQRLRDLATASSESGGPHLSTRELEVLGLLAEGRPSDEVAEQLGLTPGAVRNHISSILLKLQADSRVQAEERAARTRPV